MKVVSCMCTMSQDAAPCAGKLLEAINRDFGGLDALQAKMSADSAAVQVRCRLSRRVYKHMYRAACLANWLRVDCMLVCRIATASSVLGSTRFYSETLSVNTAVAGICECSCTCRAPPPSLVAQRSVEHNTET